MRILITGATGFIGFHLAQRLARDGHSIVACARQADVWRERLPFWEWRTCDFMRDAAEADWTYRVADVDLVINAVGIIGENRHQTFHRVQTETPQALFSACSRAGVKVVQISALGADESEIATPFLRSKREADDFLWELPGECLVLYPSIVIGEGGNSTALFCRLAVLPVVPLPGDGKQRISPIHVDDVCEAVTYLVSHWPGNKQRLWLTGADVLTVRELLALLREKMRLGTAWFVSVPMFVLDVAARVGGIFAPAGLLQRDTLTMLERVVTHEHSCREAPPRPLREALWSWSSSSAWREEAVAAMMRPLLVISLALVWIATGLISVWWNVPAGYALMASAGIAGPMASFAIYGGGIADLGLGLLLLFGWRRRLVCVLQMGMMAAYLGIASLIVPWTWLDPLGPLTKTLPMLALTAMLALESTSKGVLHEERKVTL